MKCPATNMRRSEKVQIKEQKPPRNLLANAAKMKITKAMANSNKLQLTNKLQNTIISDALLNHNNNSNNNGSCSGSANLIGRRHLGQILELEKEPPRTPILHFMTSADGTNEEHSISAKKVAEEQQAHTSNSYSHSLVQQQVNREKETAASMSMRNERSQVKVEHTSPPLLTTTTTTTTTAAAAAVAATTNTIATTTTSATALTYTASGTSEEKVVFLTMHDAYKHRSLEPASSTSVTITTTAAAAAVAVAPATATKFSTPLSSQTVLRCLPTQVVVENASNRSSISIEGTLAAAESVTAAAAAAVHKFEVSSIEDFQIENNRCSDVVNETRNNILLQQQSVSDKDTYPNLAHKCQHMNNTTLTNDANSVISNSEDNNKIQNCVLTINNCKSANVTFQKASDLSELQLQQAQGKQHQANEALPVHYRGQNNSVIIANYTHQQRGNIDASTTTQIVNELQDDRAVAEEELHQQAREEEEKAEEGETSDLFLQRYEQRQQQTTLQSDERKENNHNNNNNNNNHRGDPNLNEAAFQEHQQYLLNTYNSCVYDLSLHHHLQQQQQQQHEQVDLNLQQQQQQQQQQQTNLTPYNLHLQPLTQALHLFDDINANNSGNNNNSNSNSNNSNNTGERNNMPGNMTLYASYAHEPHHHLPHHLHHAHALQNSHASIAHTPTSIDEVIQDTLKDECLDEHHGGGLSYCTLTAVADLPGLKETYYQQQLAAHEHHLAQQHHQQQQQLQQQQAQPLLQQHLQALNHHHQHQQQQQQQQQNQVHHEMHNGTSGSGGESPPPSSLIHNNMGVDMGGNGDMVTLQSFTHLSNASIVPRDPYGSLTPDHTPNLYFTTSISPGLQNR